MLHCVREVDSESLLNTIRLHMLYLKIPTNPSPPFKFHILGGRYEKELNHTLVEGEWAEFRSA